MAIVMFLALSGLASAQTGTDASSESPGAETPPVDTDTGEAPADPGADAEADPGVQTQRDTTRAELERQIEIITRQQEELQVRIGDEEPTDLQRSKLLTYGVQIDALTQALDETKERNDAKILFEGDTFQGRMLRLREAFRDVSRYNYKDGMFRIRFGARFQLDTTFANGDDAVEALAGSLKNSIEFRRARIFAQGRFLRSVDFVFEYDFAADQGLKDAFIEGGKGLKVARWRLGKFKEPFSLSRATSANYLGFMEWPLPVPAFAPGRNFGVMLRHNEAIERMTWEVAATTNGRSTDDNRSSAKVSLTGRITGLPLFRNGGVQLIHLGVSYTKRDPEDDIVEASARPEARFAPFFVDTGPVAADNSSAVALELAAVVKRFWVQSEWFGFDAEATGGDVDLDGAYVEAGWFLTGESRNYRMRDATFGRLTPIRLYHGGNPFRRGTDSGALEIIGRWSTIDLNDGPVAGGEMRDLSVGLNWYLSQASRVSVNFVRTHLLDVGRANLLLMRYQYNP